MDREQLQHHGTGHRGRLRDRFLHSGLGGFSEAEILELLLSFGTPRKDCKQAARQLLETFGCFTSVLDASPQALQQIRGVGPKNAFALQFIQAVATYYLKQRLPGKKYLSSSTEVMEFLLHSMRGRKRELFTVIFLDTSFAVIETEVLAEGTINVNTVYPREVMVRALHHNAAAIVLAHNHPSGSLKVSEQDIRLTKALVLTGQQMHIRVLDHIIIGDGVLSFADEGVMGSIEAEVDRAKSSLLS